MIRSCMTNFVLVEDVFERRAQFDHTLKINDFRRCNRIYEHARIENISIRREAVDYFGNFRRNVEILSNNYNSISATVVVI